VKSVRRPRHAGQDPTPASPHDWQMAEMVRSLTSPWSSSGCQRSDAAHAPPPRAVPPRPYPWLGGLR
jgi:hypothetical protein